jgi:hypothetical protein
VFRWREWRERGGWREGERGKEGSMKAVREEGRGVRKEVYADHGTTNQPGLNYGETSLTTGE